ncbi:MAG: FeoA domain-containing protein [Clostridia bacterium]|nr:FeoA domain-containing protein [Clostridia bacterium]
MRKTLGRKNMTKTLDTFVVGQQGVVKIVNGERKIKRRLFDMGITPGAHIMVRKLAPLGDPMEITIRGYELTLRKVEAAFVTMEVTK